MRKTNAFIDRRFGEDDDTLTNDERAILRFQKQRLREMSGSSKFALADEGGEEEQLTHLGRSLAELQGAAEGQASNGRRQHRVPCMRAPATTGARARHA